MTTMMKKSGFITKHPAALRLPALILLFILIQQGSYLNRAFAYSPEKADFTVRFRNESCPYRIMGVYALPGEWIRLEAVDSKGGKQFLLTQTGGRIIQSENNCWQWQAPRQPHLCSIRIRDTRNSDSISLNIFIMIPYTDLQGEYLGHYRIGKYPSKPLKNLPIYTPPRGFVEVTRENEKVLVSPHFHIGQFTCKQDSGYPRYLVLNERLLLKLELILEAVNENGYPCNTLHIMSGYRTPYYNEAIGNVKYSRHIWGGAADIFIDENPRDGMMDDLNHDGQVNFQDAAVISDIIDTMYGIPRYKPFVGGLGRYRKTEHHGPFVHVDVRGYRARWEH